MTRSKGPRWWWPALAALACLMAAFVLSVARETGPLPEPRVPGSVRHLGPLSVGAHAPAPGQPGKDVIWLPTAETMVDVMLDLAGVTSHDYVIDLGSGDGRTVIAAAARGAKALGIEYDAGLVAVSAESARAAGVADRAQFVRADIFESDVSEATVITMFLLPELNMRLRPMLLNLRPGTRVVSNTFMMDDWMPDDTGRPTGKCDTWCVALLWVVPAKVAGGWTFSGRTLTLHQQFQMITGTLRTPAGVFPLEHGRMRGTQIEFEAGGTRYGGVVRGDQILGQTAAPGTSGSWIARRAKQP